jgi:hypothetical protein
MSKQLEEAMALLADSNPDPVKLVLRMRELASEAPDEEKIQFMYLLEGAEVLISANTEPAAPTA